MKKTKILATYGPAIANPTIIRRLVEAGVNVFRVNCSHGDSADYAKAVRTIRQGTKGAPYPVGILFDLSGPKFRLERFEGSLPISMGQHITLTSGTSNLAGSTVGVNHPAILKSVKKGERVFVDDGVLAFEVLKASSREVVLKALNAGTVLPAKGINLPDSTIEIPTITEKDKADIASAVASDADYLAVSFVRSGDDILQAKSLIHRAKGHQRVIAKLEKREAIEDLENILLVADGVMVARGDLGVELPPAELPRLQKKILALANRHHKPVIVATQMLESMRFSPRATRAEINDVAGAVFDFADAVMLSAETATGQYPLEAVQTMTSVIETTEPSCHPPELGQRDRTVVPPIPFAIAEAVSRADMHTGAMMIFAFTTSGFTAQMLSNLFPTQPIIALTPDQQVMRQLSLFRSVYPIQIKQPKSFADMLAVVDELCAKYSLGAKGETVVITGGAPFGSTAPTNFMMFHQVR
ncbi:MAG: pyruvate kinase [Candidatus Zixiibacteriota bacterium]